MKRLLSLFLAICMLASLFVGGTPQNALAAEIGTEVTDVTELQNLLDNSTETVFTLSGTLWLNQTITIPAGRTVTLRAKDDNRVYFRPGSEEWPVGAPLFKIMNRANVTFENVTINGTYNTEENAEKLAQGITVENGGANVTLDAVSIFNCNAHTGSGAGLCVGKAPATNPGTLKLLNKCVFWNNVTSMSVPTGGGAIYVNSGYTVTMERTEFKRQGDGSFVLTLS